MSVPAGSTFWAPRAPKTNMKRRRSNADTPRKRSQGKSVGGITLAANEGQEHRELPTDLIWLILEMAGPGAAAVFETTCTRAQKLLESESKTGQGRRTALLKTWLQSIYASVQFLERQDREVVYNGRFQCERLHTPNLDTRRPNSLITCFNLVQSCRNPLVSYEESTLTLVAIPCRLVQLPNQQELPALVKTMSDPETRVALSVSWQFVNHILHFVCMKAAQVLRTKFGAHPALLDVHPSVLRALWIKTLKLETIAEITTDLPVIGVYTERSFAAARETVFAYCSSIKWFCPAIVEGETGRVIDPIPQSMFLCHSLTCHPHRLRQLDWKFPGLFDDDIKHGDVKSRQLSDAFFEMISSLRQLKSLHIETGTMPSQFWKRLLQVLEETPKLQTTLKHLDCENWMTSEAEFQDYLEVFRRHAPRMNRFPGLLVPRLAPVLVQLFAMTVQMYAGHCKQLDLKAMRDDLLDCQDDLRLSIDPPSWIALLSSFPAGSLAT